jgi:hypothetical protein
LTERSAWIAALKKTTTSIRDRSAFACRANRAACAHATVGKKRDTRIGDLTATTLARSATTTDLRRRTLLTVECAAASIAGRSALNSKLRARLRNASRCAAANAQRAAATACLLSAALAAALDEAAASITGGTAVDLQISARELRASVVWQTTTIRIRIAAEARRLRAAASIFSIAAVVECAPVFGATVHREGTANDR